MCAFRLHPSIKSTHETNFIKSTQTMEEKEIWKPIKGYETRYEVSNLGRVRSLSRLIERKMKGNLIKNGCVLSQGTTTHGYKQVFLYLDNVGKMHLVHRLVAEAFLEHVNGCDEINHKDENKDNNRVENLEWCNRKYNTNYGNRNKPMWKKVYQYTIDNELVAIYNNISETKYYGFTPSGVIMCCQGKYKTHKGYKWSYTLNS